MPVSTEVSCEKLEKILLNNEGIVASGIYYPWAEKLIDYFDLLIVVETDDKIRKKDLLKENIKCMVIEQKKVEICLNSLIGF